jgi:hypothetical protein
MIEKMTDKNVTKAYILTSTELRAIEEKAQAMGDASSSAALRSIIREWLDLRSRESTLSLSAQG